MTTQHQKSSKPQTVSGRTGESSSEETLIRDALRIRLIEYQKRLWRRCQTPQAKHALHVVWSFLFPFLCSGVELLSGSAPLALVCVCSARRNVPVVFLGAFCGACLLSPFPVPYALAVLCAALLRYTVGRYLLWDIGKAKCHDALHENKESSAKQVNDASATRTQIVIEETTDKQDTTNKSNSHETTSFAPPFSARTETLGTTTAETPRYKQWTSRALSQAKLLSQALFPVGVFRQTTTQRCAVAGIGAAVAALGLGMAQTQLSAFLQSFLGLIGLCMLFTYFFSGAADDLSVGARAEMGLGAVLYALTMALSPLYIGGISIQTVSAFLLTLYVSKYGGILRGAFAGILVGMACDLTYAPLFALCGMVSGFLWQYGAALAILCALFVSGGYAVYIGHFAALRGVVPDLLIAAAAAYPLSLWKNIPRPALFANTDERSRGALATDAVANRRRQRDMSDKLDALCRVLTDLSQTFSSLSHRAQRPLLPQVRQSCEKIMGEYCSHCSSYAMCWEGQTRATTMRHNLFSISSLLCEEGEITEAAFSDPLRHRCRCLKEIISALNLEMARLSEHAVKQDKIGVFAQDYENMAQMLTAAVEANNEEYRRDPILSEQMREALEQLDFYVQDFAVFGKRQKTVIASGVNLRHLRMGTRELQLALEHAAGIRYETPLFEMKQDCVTMTVHSAPSFAVSWGRGQNKKESEDVGGDVMNVFQSRDNYFYALLSDGMGSGREASVTAQICAMFVQQMLIAGNAVAVTLEMLNHFLRSRQTECTTTVDLLQIDLLNGRAAFIKSGAAASYLIRGEKLYRIRSQTPPVGILEDLHARQTVFDLAVGDRIVLLSDGIADGEEAGWLGEVLIYDASEDPGIMAQRIIHRAAQKNGTARDDLSALVLQITPANGAQSDDR